MNNTDDIIRRCAKNDPKAQALLYDSYKNRLMGVCTRYASNRSEAEDILQESFYAILKHISKVREYENIFGWMRRICINKAINYHKKNKKHKDHYSTDEDSSIEVSDMNFQLIESGIDAEQLLNLVNSLPSGYRIVFNMYVIDGYAHKEIAAQLKITENTSKSQLFKAKAMLRSRLEQLNKIRYAEK